MRRPLALAGLLLLGGCSSAAVTLAGGALGFAASALRLDAAIVEAWSAERARKPDPPIPEENE